jgi:mono/diheme cytochrome c family protein
MTQDDVRDLFAYLRTLPAVQGKARDHDLPLPFRIRRVLGLWKFLFLDDRQFEPDAGKPREWNRGAYLVNGPGHCAECHSPRNRLGGIIASGRFTGGPDPEGSGGSIPNITPAGIGDFSQADIEHVLESGELPDGDSVGGAMRAVVRNTSQLPAADRSAIAAYLKSLPPVKRTNQPGR